jgi:hypothetical protein
MGELKNVDEVGSSPRKLIAALKDPLACTRFLPFLCTLPAGAGYGPSDRTLAALGDPRVALGLPRIATAASRSRGAKPCGLQKPEACHGDGASKA